MLLRGALLVDGSDCDTRSAGGVIADVAVFDRTGTPERIQRWLKVRFGKLPVSRSHTCDRRMAHMR
jgi:hypothetical protein